MCRVLVTGAAGYIGSSLCCKLVKSGYDVIGVDNLSYNQGAYQIPDLPAQFSRCRINHVSAGRYEFYREDVRNIFNNSMRALIEDSDVIIHLAAIVGAPACDKIPERETERINVESVDDLVAMLKPEQRLIYPNTNSGYGKSGLEPCTESTIINCLSKYAKQKYQGELFALRHPNSVVFRLATVFGLSPRMRLDLLVNSLTYEAFFKRHIAIFEPYARRNYVHVLDVVSAMIWAINHGGKKEVYNLGNDAINSTKEELVNTIKRHTNITCWVQEGEDKDKRDYIVSSNKLAKAGFQAKISLDDGIKELISWFETLPHNDDERSQLLRWMRNA